MRSVIFTLGLCLGITSCAYHNCFYDNRGSEIASEVSHKLDGFESSKSPILGRETYIKLEGIPSV